MPIISDRKGGSGPSSLFCKFTHQIKLNDMPMYTCQRTFTSQTSHKMYCIGQEINQCAYDCLRLTEQHNFKKNMACEYTPPPVFNPSTFDTININHSQTSHT